MASGNRCARRLSGVEHSEQHRRLGDFVCRERAAIGVLRRKRDDLPGRAGVATAVERGRFKQMLLFLRLMTMA